MANLVDGVVFYAVFLFSTTLHEAAHAWAALRGGDRTAYEGGQVSLDPLPHMKREPIGMIGMPLLTVLLTGWPIGFASAPYDRRFPPLDGSAAIVLLMPKHMIAKYQRFLWSNAYLGLIGILIAWRLFAGAFDPIFTWAISLLYPGVSYS